MSEEKDKRVWPCGKSVYYKESASGAALLIQMSEGNVEKSLRQIYSVGAAVDLYLAVRDYSRQCHSNQIMEE